MNNFFRSTEQIQLLGFRDQIVNVNLDLMVEWVGNVNEREVQQMCIQNTDITQQISTTLRSINQVNEIVQMQANIELMFERGEVLVDVVCTWWATQYTGDEVDFDECTSSDGKIEVFEEDDGWISDALQDSLDEAMWQQQEDDYYAREEELLKMSLSEPGTRYISMLELVDDYDFRQ